MSNAPDAQQPETIENDPPEGTTHDTAAPRGTLLGRAQAARLLGVSKSTLRRMEGETLTPVVGPKNVRLFHEEQIQSMIVTRRSEIAAMRPTGDIAADVFASFDEGVHPVDVVKRLRLEPDLIERLHQGWCRLRGYLVVSEAAVATLHRMLSDEETTSWPRSEGDLLAFARQWVQEQSLRHCVQCGTESAQFCRTCAKKWGLRAAKNENLAQQHSRL